MPIAASDNLRINPNIAREGAVTLRDFARTLSDGQSWDSIRRAAAGQVSTVTGEIVQLEVCYLHNNRLSTSHAAYCRFIDRLNGRIE